MFCSQSTWSILLEHTFPASNAASETVARSRDVPYGCAPITSTAVGSHRYFAMLPPVQAGPFGNENSFNEADFIVML